MFYSMIFKSFYTPLGVSFQEIATSQKSSEKKQVKKKPTCDKVAFMDLIFKNSNFFNNLSCGPLLPNPARGELARQVQYKPFAVLVKRSPNGILYITEK